MAEVDITHLQILAIASVEDPSWEDQYRGICRWYSKEYATPLHIVEQELDRMQVLRHYYEDAFKRLSDSQDENQQVKYEEIREKILYGAKSEAELAEETAEDDDWADQMIRDIEQDEEKRKKEVPVEPVMTKKVSTSEALENPNLEEDIEFSVQGEDDPPDF